MVKHGNSLQIIWLSPFCLLQVEWEGVQHTFQWGLVTCHGQLQKHVSFELSAIFADPTWSCSRSVCSSLANVSEVYCNYIFQYLSIGRFADFENVWLRPGREILLQGQGGDFREFWSDDFVNDQIPSISVNSELVETSWTFGTQILSECWMGLDGIWLMRLGWVDSACRSTERELTAVADPRLSYFVKPVTLAVCKTSQAETQRERERE